jgi:hypothetical protein
LGTIVVELKTGTDGEVDGAVGSEPIAISALSSLGTMTGEFKLGREGGRERVGSTDDVRVAAHSRRDPKTSK